MPITLSQLKNDADYLSLPQTERAKVVETLVKQDADFMGLADTEKVKVMNTLVGYDKKPTISGVKQASNSTEYTLGKPSLDNLTANLKTAGKGLISGAADIGNTLINASTAIPRMLSPELEKLNQQREAGLQQFNKENEGDAIYGAGRLAGNIAGTAGVGGAAGLGLKAASKTPRALALAESIASSGLTGTTANKIAGGATSGALGSLLVDPESAKTGAAVGGAIPVAGKVASSLGNVVSDVIGAIGTHTGGETIKQAARAGYKGGETAKQFTSNLRGQVPITDVLDTAKQNIYNMAQTKAAEYRKGMTGVSGDKTVLSFNGIDNAIQDAQGIASYKGQSTNQKATDALDKINQAVSKWKGLDPAEYHTPEGLDALKRQISGIQESIPFEEKTARKVAGNIYNAIKNEISQQAPAYDKVMKGYSEATEQIAEIEKALSLGKKASVDTAIRKLQSLTRNNVNTNYGNRLKLAEQLEQQGGNEIIPALSGQALGTLAPRGLGNLQAGGTALAAYLNPSLLPLLLTQSPRLVGEAAYGAGKLSKFLGKNAKTIAPASGALTAALNR